MDEDAGYTTRVFISIDGDQRGYFLIRNAYRKGLNEVMSALKPEYDLHLLSGDNDSELPNLLPYFQEREKLRFRQSPADKLNYIEKLKEKEKHTLMIGDGLNDAGALNASDVGITIADDIYHFSPACDAILEAEKFPLINHFIHFTGKAMTIVRISFVISFLYNIVGIYFAVNGFLTPVIAAILMPLSSISVVAYVTLATTVAAKKAGFVTRS
jgi:Cu+-exporting ATPase